MAHKRIRRLKLVRSLFVVVGISFLGPFGTLRSDASQVLPSHLSDAERDGLMDVDVQVRAMLLGDVAGKRRTSLGQLFEAGRTRFMVSPFSSVQERYLSFLLDELRSTPSISVDDARNVESILSLKADDESVQRAKDRVRWMLTLRRIDDSVQRVTFLNRYVTDLSDDYYFAFSAMDDLMLHGAAGEQTLTEVIELQNKGPLDSGLVQKAQINLAKIRLLRRIAALGEADKTRVLEAALPDTRAYGGGLGSEFQTWVVRQLVASGRAAVPVLQRVAVDPSVPLEARQVARQATSTWRF